MALYDIDIVATCAPEETQLWERERLNGYTVTYSNGAIRLIGTRCPEQEFFRLNRLIYAHPDHRISLRQHHGGGDKDEEGKT